MIMPQRFQHELIRELEEHFSRRLALEARFDLYTRIIYSTDASNHQVEPFGVVFPRNDEELLAAVEKAAELSVPLLARGAGTSLAGQAIGRALILDCSRYLNRILEVDRQAGTALVEPGVVLNKLNARAHALGLTFGPDPASADRATLGGMIGNNAAGAHSIRYGMTIDHTLAAEVALSDGSPVRLGPLSEPEARRRAAVPTLEGAIYRRLLEIRDQYREVVRQDWPRTWRRASGYSLNYLVGFSPGRPPAWHERQGPYPPDEGVNLARLLCSSEGTLAVLRRVKLRLVPQPKAAVLAVLPFDNILAACEATPELLELGPSAVELLPRTIFQRAAQIPAYARKLTFLEGDAEAILVVEFAADSHDQALCDAQALSGRGHLLEDARAQADLWEVRKAGLGLLMSVTGDVKPITFIEDVAVPVEQLADYVREVTRILAEHGTTGEWYAHASAGCLHLRPLINLKTLRGVQQMRGIADAVADLVVAMRGSLSGEHGDGISHTEFNLRLFGPRLIQAFQDIKAAFDPHGLLNPGKVVPSDEYPWMVDQDLRYGPTYRAEPPRTYFAYRRDGDFAHAVEACTGVGVCRKEGGVMCPSYQATRDEAHSTRGRANALRAALSGRLPAGALTSRQMYRVLELCLGCKGCRAECPTGVDMARIKADFLALYQARHGVPLRSRVFANVHTLASLASPLAPLVNLLAGAPATRWLGERLLGVSRRRRLPSYASEDFLRWLQRRELAGRAGESVGSPVVLFVDTFTRFNHPRVGKAAVQLLEAAGYRPLLVEGQVCCGRPMISKGMLRQAKELAARNLNALAPYAEKGIPILGLEPSCLLTLRDEYLEFYPDDERAHAVAEKALLIEEFLTQPDGEGGRPLDRLAFKAPAAPLLLHGHCHAKALVGSAPMMEMLQATGAKVREADASCCGMAGSFGYEAEHYDLSMQIGALRLFPAVRRAAQQGETVVTAGTSCRTQIQDGTGTCALHPVEVMAQSLE